MEGDGQGGAGVMEVKAASPVRPSRHSSTASELRELGGTEHAGDESTRNAQGQGDWRGGERAEAAGASTAQAKVKEGGSNCDLLRHVSLRRRAFNLK